MVCLLARLFAPEGRRMAGFKKLGQQHAILNAIALPTILESVDKKTDRDVVHVN
ncbi:MAG: hypothetical protein HQL63_13715 [Magnetococcales bacterium]|nr:hypothetical protein [Magnetococcales bacterium]